MTSLDARLFEAPLDRGSGIPLYRQVYQQIREAVLTARLRPGAMLPPTRLLAQDLGVSRNTILLAYEQLIVEGYLVGRVGAGTRVTPTLEGRLLERYGQIPTERSEPRAVVSERCRALEEIPTPLPSGRGRGRAFTVGLSAGGEFPWQTWSRLTRRHLARSRQQLGDPVEPAGYRPLREALCAYLGSARGLRCDPDQIVIVSGTQQALDLATRTVTDPGQRAVIEDPCYPGARGVFRAAGLSLVPVPVDRLGLQTAALPPAPSGVRLAFVAPSHQFPLGVTMSLERRLRLLEWAQEAGAWLIEDDYDSEFRHEGQAITALQGLDEGDRVIYVGSFGKALLPTLRLGYIVLPRSLVAPLLRLRMFTDLGPALLPQLVLRDFLAEGHFGRHLRKVRKLFRRRRDLLLELARAELGGLLEFEPDRMGLSVVGWLPAGTGARDTVVATAAAAAGVEVLPLSQFYEMPPLRQGLVFGFGAADEARIHQGIHALRPVLEGIAGNGAGSASGALVAAG